ncbi:MAG: CPBP family intramembrane metalloprotease [Candidatus Margulisbacteria bacterium]|nr:CPBP family intramembrane metalloprotease [Candidatus Margulisiibacteriota bacterium]MBU1022283.1 CPBP family intramembrane metalloprotease [Candidatus Margulisiibacteriota bacterium]MBU1729278.1 CPBP family intramembrane metalloprotease [Candidatus Margulisiibacteriota bacterium]MBU1955551.1 CPBP family intramembrane metalloprotease [Candidatus Margulisiibacteriota bacterium]
MPLKKVITYTILVYLLSIPGYLLSIFAKKIGFNPFLAIFILMWTPALSAFITKLLFDRNLRGLGWSQGQPRWLALGYLLPIAYGAAAFGFLQFSGMAKINPDYHIGLYSLIIFGTFFNIAFAAGEEIGWRGFLVPELNKITNFTVTAFTSGIIWALWHFPLLLFAGYVGTIPLAERLPFFVISVTAMAFALAWLRLKSLSVWPAILLHASHNNYIQRLFDPLSAPVNKFSKYFIGETGIALLIMTVIVAVVFWSMRKNLPGEIQAARF